jgi:hypothetical protein
VYNFHREAIERSLLVGKENLKQSMKMALKHRSFGAMANVLCKINIYLLNFPKFTYSNTKALSRGDFYCFRKLSCEEKEAHNNH